MFHVFNHDLLRLRLCVDTITLVVSFLNSSYEIWNLGAREMVYLVQLLSCKHEELE